MATKAEGVNGGSSDVVVGFSCPASWSNSRSISLQIWRHRAGSKVVDWVAAVTSYGLTLPVALACISKPLSRLWQAVSAFSY
jgi:hypothetical protein